MGGTHLTVVIVSVFLSSSLAWMTRRQELHTAAPPLLTEFNVVDHHIIVLIQSASTGNPSAVIRAQLQQHQSRHIWTVTGERSSCPSSVGAIKSPPEALP
jgi:hypothetical protein